MQIAQKNYVARTRPVDITIHDLSRWETAGRRLENIAPSVLAEIHVDIDRTEQIASMSCG